MDIGMMDYMETNKDFQPKKDLWAVIDFSGDGRRNLVCFRNSDGDFYWGQRNTRATLSSKTEIVEVLGYFPEEEWDELEISFIKKYWTLEKGEIRQSAGWLSPSGDWYTCKPWGHDFLALVIAVHLYDSLDVPVKRLEHEGWFRIYADGLIACGGWDWNIEVSDIITLKQQETISKLSTVGDKDWNRKMKQWLIIDAR